MPSNDRWDLIRRLKVNVFYHPVTTYVRNIAYFPCRSCCFYTPILLLVLVTITCINFASTSCGSKITYRSSSAQTWTSKFLRYRRYTSLLVPLVISFNLHSCFHPLYTILFLSGKNPRKTFPFPSAIVRLIFNRNNYLNTECNRRNGPDFGRVFRMLNYTENPQNTYIQS